jgi:MFS family permease
MWLWWQRALTMFSPYQFWHFLPLCESLSSRFHYIAFIVLRLLQGLTEGVTFSSLYTMITKWVPLEERNSFIARSVFAGMIGNVVTFSLCGFLSHHYGWESGFYVTGCCTCKKIVLKHLNFLLVTCCSSQTSCLVCVLVLSHLRHTRQTPQNI